MKTEHQICCFYCLSRWLLLRKSFERVYKVVDKLQDFLQQENNNLADCLAKNAFLLKLACLFDIFAKLNKLNISMQEPGSIYA